MQFDPTNNKSIPDQIGSISMHLAKGVYWPKFSDFYERNKEKLPKDLRDFEWYGNYHLSPVAQFRDPFDKNILIQIFLRNPNI